MKKRISALLLSLVITVSSLGAPALAAEKVPAVDPAAFTDAADISHWEAVATLCQLGVIKGEDEGTRFDPAETLTRAEAAKLISLIYYNGADLALLNPDTSYVPEKRGTFTDMQDHWAELYVEYCVEFHIVAGRGDGRFDPDAQITGLELVKMALSMLRQYGNDHIVGDSWADRTDALARSAYPSLYKGLDGIILTQPITRDDAAQVLYNALQGIPKLVVDTRYTNSGELVPIFGDLTINGSTATLLRMLYRLDEFPAIPTQPGK